MTKIQNSNKKYDLEERTFAFAKRAHVYFNGLPKSQSNREIAKQGIRSAGSVGANYIEANESLSKKDFMMRAKICRKEAKETIYWLRLSEPSEQHASEKDALMDEVTEIMKIFGAIVTKSS